MTNRGQALKTGSLLHEFRIEKILGEGGFGLTYLAFDENLEKYVAIKEYLPTDFAIRAEGNTVIPRTEKSKEDFNWGLKAFLDEARALAKFDHPNIVRINRFFKINGTAYIVMEYIKGRTLGATIKELEKLTEEEVLALLLPLIDGLKQVHQQHFYHRDIKPDNIILRDTGSPVLIDFGAARQAIGSKSRSITTIVTPGYAPIEQYSSKGKLGAWTDIYALAAVAYTCLTGERPDDSSDRVVEDAVIPVVQAAAMQGRPDFLLAIDNGLEIRAKDRPQTLKDWGGKLVNDTNVTRLSGDEEVGYAAPVLVSSEFFTNYMPIKEFSEMKGISENEIMMMIKDGVYIGMINGGEWFVNPDGIKKELVNEIKNEQSQVVGESWEIKLTEMIADGTFYTYLGYLAFIGVTFLMLMFFSY